MPRATRRKKVEKEDEDPVGGGGGSGSRRGASTSSKAKKTAETVTTAAAAAAVEEKKKKDSSKTVNGKGNEEIDETPNANDDESPELEGMEVMKKEENILKALDSLQYGPRKDRSMYLKMIGDSFVRKSIQQLKAEDYAARFIRRITALTWHEKYPYALASASKFGDITFVEGVRNESESARNESPLKFETKMEIEGGGAGYSVTAMKFHEQDLNILYRVGIDCVVAKIDLAHRAITQIHDTGDYNRWFCSMDLNFSHNMLVAGDNKGLVYQFDINGGGELMKTWRLHNNKIHQCEFSKRDPNLLVTASLDAKEAVKIWDVRYIKKLSSEKPSDFKPLHVLQHSAPLSSARFSPVDGSRLLTTDQKDEIRIYQGPLWKDYTVIKHHHKHFQHLTPIKADWHPVNDYVVVGRYPKTSFVDGKKAPASQRMARAIEFFDSYSGKLIDAIYPPLDEICSLNVFNPTGEYLATGMNSKLILWKPKLSFDALTSSSKSKTPGEPISKVPLSEGTRNILRGRRAREYSPASDDEDDNDDAPKKKRPKKAPSTATKTGTKSTTDSKPTKKKK